MNDNRKFIIGSRGSKLSLAYSTHAKNLLIKSNSKLDNNSIEIKVIKTSGDIFQNKRISEIGGNGVFCCGNSCSCIPNWMSSRNNSPWEKRDAGKKQNFGSTC